MQSGWPNIYVLFLRSLHEGRVPDDWRASRFKPLYKSCKKQRIPNYHPISLTLITCKLLEHLIHMHICEFLSNYNVLTKHQDRFRKRLFNLYSTCRNNACYRNWNFNSGKQTDAIFKDFAKAFDWVSHKTFLFKWDKTLKNLCLIKWITDYLINC